MSISFSFLSLNTQKWNNLDSIGIDCRLHDASCRSFVAVIVFAAVGRASHGESVAGTFVTAWPFLVACAVAWIVLALLGDDGRGWRAGVIVWLVTLIGGMALRVAAGDTAAVAFIVVATLFLAATLFGWRLIARLIDRRRAAAAA